MRLTYKNGRFTGQTLNYSTPDLSELTSKRPEMIAYCTSSKCTENFRARIELKNIPNSQDTCPHCNHYIVWKKKDNRFK